MSFWDSSWAWMICKTPILVNVICLTNATECVRDTVRACIYELTNRYFVFKAKTSVSELEFLALKYRKLTENVEKNIMNAMWAEIVNKQPETETYFHFCKYLPKYKVQNKKNSRNVNDSDTEFPDEGKNSFVWSFRRLVQPFI